MNASLSIAPHPNDILPWTDASAQAGVSQSISASSTDATYVFRFKINEASIQATRAQYSAADPNGSITLNASVQTSCGTSSSSQTVLGGQGEMQGQIIELAVDASGCGTPTAATLSGWIATQGDINVFGNGALDINAQAALLQVRRV